MPKHQGLTLKKILKMYDISTKDFAESLGVARQTVYSFYGHEKFKPQDFENFLSCLKKLVKSQDVYSEILDSFKEDEVIVKNDTSKGTEFYETLLAEKDDFIAYLKKELERYQKREDEFYSNIKDLIKQNGNSGGSLGKLLEIRDSQPAPAKVFKVLGERMSETVGK